MEANKISQKLYPFVKMVEKCGDVPLHLRMKVNFHPQNEAYLQSATCLVLKVKDNTNLVNIHHPVQHPFRNVILSSEF